MASHSWPPKNRVDAWGKAVHITLILLPFRMRLQGKQALESCLLLMDIHNFETSLKLPKQNSNWCVQRLGDGKIKEFIP